MSHRVPLTRVSGILHLPYLVIVLFLLAGLVGRMGYLWRGAGAVCFGLLACGRP